MKKIIRGIFSVLLGLIAFYLVFFLASLLISGSIKLLSAIPVLGGFIRAYLFGGPTWQPWTVFLCSSILPMALAGFIMITIMHWFNKEFENLNLVTALVAGVVVAVIGLIWGIQGIINGINIYTIVLDFVTVGAGILIAVFGRTDKER